jgi:hypothetical protein
MSRTSDILAYAVVATLLVCGSLYALTRYAESGVPPAQQTARLLASSAAIPTPIQNPWRVVVNSFSMRLTVRPY